MTNNNPDQIAIKDILTSSPPGQFDQILTSLRSMIHKSKEAELLNPDFITALRSDWEESSGRSILAAATDGGSNSDGDAAECTDESVQLLTKSMDDYLARHFSSAGVQAAQKIVRENDGGADSAISVTVYVERIDLKNFNASSWKGTYSILPTSNSLSGEVVICAHTFENGGNFQLHSKMKLDSTSFKSAAGSHRDAMAWTEEAVKKIETFEKEQVLGKLKEMYESMNSVHLKNLRRVMPVTRTKMEWNVLAHRLVHTLGVGHGKERAEA
mmetsp:Transcript_19847/g.39811  ORF Transcript_19847/g.39811 Transcript_19847/m.39811 type:complete len:270 (-) Transcript_19847:92-901(-)